MNNLFRFRQRPLLFSIHQTIGRGRTLTPPISFFSLSPYHPTYILVYVRPQKQVIPSLSTSLFHTFASVVWLTEAGTKKAAAATQHGKFSGRLPRQSLRDMYIRNTNEFLRRDNGFFFLHLVFGRAGFIG